MMPQNLINYENSTVPNHRFLANFFVFISLDSYIMFAYNIMSNLYQYFDYFFIMCNNPGRQVYMILLRINRSSSKIRWI